MKCNKCEVELDEKKVQLSPIAKYALCDLCNEQLRSLLNETINPLIYKFIQPNNKKVLGKFICDVCNDDFYQSYDNGNYIKMSKEACAREITCAQKIRSVMRFNDA
jgi:hypothetical protein